MSKFTNTVKVEWMPDHPRNMRLLEDVTFIDANGKEWTAHAGHIINGASFKFKGLWIIFGSPFIGKFRRATVIHDVQCDIKKEPHNEVHKAFEEMMECDNVPKWKKKPMATAVRLLGPRW